MFGTENTPHSRPAWDFRERYAEWSSRLRKERKEKEAHDAEAARAARAALQKDALSRLMERRRLLVEWGTGTGKSRVGVLAADELLREGRERILLLVAEDAHKENWRREFLDVLGCERGEAVFAATTVECYHSLHNYEGTKWDFVIADEAHHLRSPLRMRLVRSLRSDYVLCLSATLSDKGDGEDLLRTLKETFGSFDSMDFSTQDSIDSGIIPDPMIMVHVLPLEGISHEQHVDITWGGAAGRKEYDCDIDAYRRLVKNGGRKGNALIHLRASAQEAYDAVEEEMAALKHGVKDAEAKAAEGESVDYWMKRREALLNRMVNLGGRRKQLLGESKTVFVGNLLRAMGKTRYICFCANVDQGEALGGEFAVSARNTRRENGEVIMGFNKGNHDQLFAVGMLREGQNLTGIQAGVIVQLGDKERTFVQEFGRVLRAENPVQHIVVINNTKDVDFFFSSLENVHPAYIKVRYYGMNKSEDKSQTSLNKSAFIRR